MDYVINSIILFYLYLGKVYTVQGGEEMEHRASLLWKLFQTTFSLSACTFGGGCVIVPLMRERFVDRYHWMEEKEMLNLTAIAQSAPGPLAVNASIIAGFHVAGISGALVSIVGTILPPFLTLTLISFAYSWFSSNLLLGFLLKGMQAGVAAVVLDVTLTMAHSIFVEHRIQSSIIMASGLFAMVVLHWNVVWVLLCAALFSLSDRLWIRAKAWSVSFR